MKILYDHQMFSTQKYGGVTRYFTELMKHITPGNQFKLSLLLSDNQYLKEEVSFFKKFIIPWPDKQFKGKNFLKRRIYRLNQFWSKRHISDENYDIFHPTFYDDYFISFLKKPYIITVHDLIVFKFEHQFYRQNTVRNQMERVIKSASRIIAISENTKKDIIDIFQISPNNIDVIHHGYNKPVFTKSINRYGKYILFVGGRDRYKNFKTFAKAVSPLLKKESGLKLICVGKSFNKIEIEDLSQLKIIDQVTALRATEDELNNLYANAVLFIFPSLYEGFGMPILEAFANECPVCLSDTSCFPEIAGDAAAYFDPQSESSILSTIEKLYYDDDFKNTLVKKGNERLSNFSWEKTAHETIASYQKTLLSAN